MATNLFDRVIGVAGNSGAELVFTAPSDLYLIQLDLSNVDTTGIQVSVEISGKINEEVKTINWVKGVQIPVGATISIIEGQKAVLMKDDTLTIRCDTAGETVNAFISFIKEINTFPTNE